MTAVLVLMRVAPNWNSDARSLDRGGSRLNEALPAPLGDDLTTRWKG